MAQAFYKNNIVMLTSGMIAVYFFESSFNHKECSGVGRQRFSIKSEMAMMMQKTRSIRSDESTEDEMNSHLLMAHALYDLPR